MIDSHSGPAKAKLLKMHRKKLIQQQDLRACGFRITIPLRSGSIMVNKVWNLRAPRLKSWRSQPRWLAQIWFGGPGFGAIKEGPARLKMTGQ